jgi:hypothetical protein
MPVPDGLEATRRIVADELLAGVRVLVLTTFELDEYVFEALRHRRASPRARALGNLCFTVTLLLPSRAATGRRPGGGASMANYVLLYKGGGVPASEAEQQQVMAAWGRWFEQLGQALVDGGNPFGPSTAVSPDGTVSNGAPSGMTGYSIVKADSLDAATEMARSSPIITSGGTIEVYETFEVM